MARDTDTAVTLGSKHKRTERLALDKTGTPSVTNTAVLFKLFGYCSEKENLRLKLKKSTKNGRLTKWSWFLDFGTKTSTVSSSAVYGVRGN